MVLSYAYCNVSLMPVRSMPSHSAEQVNEVLYGERVEIMEINNHDWARIRTEWDEYVGWCRLGQISFITYKDYRKPAKSIATGTDGRLVFQSGHQWVPLGADIYLVKKGKISIYHLEGKYKGKKAAIKKLELNGERLLAAAMQYMNVPYVWGGRSTAGIDCSGLSQMAYKLCGKRLPRDASQQALAGEHIDFLQDARCGDLAFFDNQDGRIVHVGILLDQHHILHATEIIGRVIIDKIDPEGIISTTFKKRTHKLRLIKRFF